MYSLFKPATGNSIIKNHPLSVKSNLSTFNLTIYLTFIGRNRRNHYLIGENQQLTQQASQPQQNRCIWRLWGILTSTYPDLDFIKKVWLYRWPPHLFFGNAQNFVVLFYGFPEKKCNQSQTKSKSTQAFLFLIMKCSLHHLKFFLHWFPPGVCINRVK